MANETDTKFPIYGYVKTIGEEYVLIEIKGQDKHFNGKILETLKANDIKAGDYIYMETYGRVVRLLDNYAHRELEIDRQQRQFLAQVKVSRASLWVGSIIAISALVSAILRALGAGE